MTPCHLTAELSIHLAIHKAIQNHVYTCQHEQWTDIDVIKALLAQGHDAIGNLLIGDQARNHFLEMPAPAPVDRTTQYPLLARAADAGEIPGSSARGYQRGYLARGAEFSRRILYQSQRLRAFLCPFHSLS